MSNNSIKIANTSSLVFMLVLNFLANFLPINGMTTGELSALYPNLFTPAGFTFSIWGIIYLLLIIYIVFQWKESNKTHLDASWPYFLINGLANGLWIIFWHYQIVIVSMIIMLIILWSLIKLYKRHQIHYFSEKSSVWYTSIPISVYLGWISVATIANASVLLVHNDVYLSFINESTWASIVLLTAVGIGLLMLKRRKDIFFMAVITWASYGVYSKRVEDIVSNESSISILQLWQFLLE